MAKQSPRPVALVTGASAGIGRSFARALADRGHDLVLVARDTPRLEELALELRLVCGTEAEVLPADLVDRGELAVVEQRLADSDRPVDLVVNNAGFGTAGEFAELPIAREDDQIRLNVIAVVHLAHAALRGMIARGRGGVINVSSIGGYQPVPHSATYGGTKAFVSSWSQAVHEELKGTGVKMMVLCPGFTRTEFQERAGVEASNTPAFLWQSSDQVVSYALGAYDRGRAVCVPGPLNTATAALTAVMPAGITRRVAARIMERAE